MNLKQYSTWIGTLTVVGLLLSVPTNWVSEVIHMPGISSLGSLVVLFEWAILRPIAWLVLTSLSTSLLRGFHNDDEQSALLYSSKFQFVHAWMSVAQGASLLAGIPALSLPGALNGLLFPTLFQVIAPALSALITIALCRNSAPVAARK
jgi:hypothetical protein